jgi:transposase
MTSANGLREDFKAEDLRALAREGQDTRQCRRLAALAAVANGRSRVEAAELGGMDRQTLRDWVHRFNAESPEGLFDRKTDGPPKLTSEQKAELAAIVEAGPDRQETGLVRWRRVDLTHVQGASDHIVRGLAKRGLGGPMLPPRRPGAESDRLM